MGTIIGVFGVPLCGKSSIVSAVTQKMLEQYRIASVSTSQLVSQLISKESKESKIEIAAQMQQGGLFPKEDEIRTAIYDMVEGLWAFGAEIVIIDGCPRFDDQMKWMRQIFFEHEIQVAQILVSYDFELTRRASKRARDAYDTDPNLLQARIANQRSKIAGIEHCIQMYGLRYFSVINDHLERAILEFTSKVNWPEIKRDKKEQVHQV